MKGFLSIFLLNLTPFHPIILFCSQIRCRFLSFVVPSCYIVAATAACSVTRRPLIAIWTTASILFINIYPYHFHCCVGVWVRGCAWHCYSAWCLSGVEQCMIVCTEKYSRLWMFQTKVQLMKWKINCATESLKKLSKVDIARPSSALLNSASCNSGQAYGLNALLLYYLYLFFESLIFKIVRSQYKSDHDLKINK